MCVGEQGFKASDDVDKSAIKVTDIDEHPLGPAGDCDISTSLTVQLVPAADGMALSVRESLIIREQHVGPLRRSARIRAPPVRLELSANGVQLDEISVEHFSAELHHALESDVSDLSASVLEDNAEVDNTYDDDAGSSESTSSEIVCNVNAELAIAQPRIAKDFLLHTACCRDPQVAAICGVRVSRGGESALTQQTLAYETVGCLSEFGLDDPQQYIAGIFEEHFQAETLTCTDVVVGAATKSKSKKKSKRGIPAPAEGQRQGNVWIAAENDSFNRILVALGLWGEASAERAKLFRINPQLPPIGRAGANTPLKAGTRVNLNSKALKASRPDVAKKR